MKLLIRDTLKTRDKKNTWQWPVGSRGKVDNSKMLFQTTADHHSVQVQHRPTLCPLDLACHVISQFHLRSHVISHVSCCLLPGGGTRRVHVRVGVRVTWLSTGDIVSLLVWGLRGPKLLISGLFLWSSMLYYDQYCMVRFFSAWYRTTLGLWYSLRTHIFYRPLYVAHSLFPVIQL